MKRRVNLGAEHPHHRIPLRDGICIVGGDAHFWPGLSSTAYRAFVKWIRKLKPAIVVMNGDVLDAPTISRHPPIGWEHLPTLEAELVECKARLGEVQRAAGKAKLLWSLGNHDARFNTRLAALTPEFRGVPGTRLVHHFPDWTPCWSVEIGGPKGAVVKHNFKGGANAAHANAITSGRTMVTGHLHSQKVTPFTDYNGTRWGVDAGCLAAPMGPQFNYSQANPRDHRSGFCVLTFRRGELLWPELVSVHNEVAGTVHWRGALYRV